MEEDMDKGKKKEAMDQIMMEEDLIKKIMEKFGKTHSGVPYQYKMNNKKRTIADREGLESDEEEVEDLQAMERLRKSCLQHMKGKQEVQGQGKKV
jgi:hypothetical protein